jgi:uncharacterized protein (DUF433 family)
MGKPCLAGTRIPVYFVLEKMGASETIGQILEAYPPLTREHVNAALQYCGAVGERRDRARFVKFLLDENLSLRQSAALRALGSDAVSVSDSGLGGTTGRCGQSVRD